MGSTLSSSNSHPSLSFFNPADTVFDVPYSEWIEYYWQTFFWSAKEQLENNKHVFCLTLYDSKHGDAENYDAQIPVDVPRDRAILYAPMRYIAMVPRGRLDLKPEMSDLATAKMDEIVQVSTFIDDNELSDQVQRVKTDYFYVDNGTNIAMCEGFFLFLKPYCLEEGKKHMFGSLSSCGTGQVQVNTKYLVNTL